MVISSRTPEGDPNRCPVCGASLKIEPSAATRDAPCPCCGHLLWFTGEARGDSLVIKTDGPMQEAESLTREDRGDSLVIKLDGPMQEAESLANLLGSVVVGRGKALTLDFVDVKFLSSSALGKLINFRKKFRGEGVELRLRNLGPDLLDFFGTTRLDQLFDCGEGGPGDG